jgi:hypothetical protein
MSRLGAARFVIHAARLVPGRPPSARLLLDVEIANDVDRPRWALLPGQLPPDEGGVFAVETLQAAGAKPVVAARILGRGGRLAVRVAPGARVRLHEAGIMWWGPPPGRIDVRLELADAVVIGGTPLDAWLAVEAIPIEDGADASLAGAMTLDSRTTDDLVALALETPGEIETMVASVTLDHAT